MNDSFDELSERSAEFDLQLRDYLEHGPVEDETVDALVEAALTEVNEDPAETKTETASGRPAWWLGVGATALAAAAAWVLIPTSATVPAQNVTPTSPAMELVYAAGEVRVDGGEARLGRLAQGADLQTGTGQACMVLRGWGDFCTGQDSQVELGADGQPVVASGRLLVALDTQRQLELAVGDGLVRGQGASFAVYRNGHSERVEVASSSLTVESLGSSWTVEAGEWIEWQDGKLLGRGESRKDADTFALLALGELWKAPLVAAGRVSLDRPGFAAQVRVDGHDLGLTPVRAYLPIGVHQFELESAGFAGFSAEVEIEAGREFAVLATMQEQELAEAAVPELELPVVEESTEPAKKVSKTVQTVSAEELLGQARAAMKDKRWTEAARIYRSLRRAYPRGDLAHAALVSLGNLELDHLGRPSQARRAYSAYLRRPGALAQEARYGLVRASEGTRGERDAIEDYMRRYANSLEMGHLKQRLGELDAAGK